MRLWSLHPRYLDTKGLLAAWREALLAKHVLLGKTKGYKNHPQLQRFKEQLNPVAHINTFLAFIHDEAKSRGYAFDQTKIGEFPPSLVIKVTSGQVAFEVKHLQNKLAVRDPKRLTILEDKQADLHPLFTLVDGPIEEWEKV